MSILKFYGDTRATSYRCSPLIEFLDWIKELDVIGLDTETNVVDSHLNRQLKVISVANEAGDTIWVLEWDFLTTPQRDYVLCALSKPLCIIQNVSFDYKVFKKEGLTLEKVYDTMLAEQVLSNGFSADKGYHGLQAIYLRRFGLDISKEEQLTFGDGGPYTDSQIEYAAVDVIKLGTLRKIQLSEARAEDKRIQQKGHRGLEKTIWWENEFVKVVADMEITGVRLDKEKWYAIEDAIRPTYDTELAALNQQVIEYLYDTLIANDWISDKDTFIGGSVWSSSAKKKILLDHIYNFPIEKTAKAELKVLLQDNDPDFPEGLKLNGKGWNDSDYPTTFNSKFAVLKLLILSGKDTPSIDAALDGFLMTNMKSFCIKQGWIRPAGELTLNWASPVQRLKIFQAINPRIESTGKEIIEDYVEEHKIFVHYLAWTDVEYQLKNFGKAFYDKHVELDGKHRTRFNQILQTGRLSSVQPNLLNIPRKNGGVYRAALIPDPGFELIDADYDGQELVITTEISQEPSWMDYLAKGYDLHSRNAELIFGDKWVDATEESCAYYQAGPDGTPLYKKCKCAGHVDMRDKSKAVSFGSIYGISFIKLAFNLKISEDEAKFILKRFFEIVPGVANMMQRFGRYAITNGHIIEPVFGRIRYFDQWKLAVPSEHGSVERAAFNTPIQSSGSAILKIAFVLMRRWINHNNHQDNIQLLLPYHDETIAQARPAYVTLGKEKVGHYMMLAAKLAGFDVKAGAKSGASWLEAH